MLISEFIDPDQQIASKDFEFIESFLKMTERTQLGWHYITDIVWIYSHVKKWPRGLQILDAGGGQGPVQFLLAEMGFQITNIDMVLPKPPIAYCRRYNTNLETLPSFEPTSYQEFLNTTGKPNLLSSKLKFSLKDTLIYELWNSQKYALSHNKWRSLVSLSSTPLGTIQWNIGNLCKMPEIPSGYFDAIVSLSALEHIPNNILDNALTEIRRVLKPNARWAVTTSGTEQSLTYWHEPSKSNCFSVSDLEQRFGSKCLNSQEPAEILEKYRQCSYLKNHIADFYKKSGKYGMPWGIWDPKYIPVGLSLRK